MISQLDTGLAGGGKASDLMDQMTHGTAASENGHRTLDRIGHNDAVKRDEDYQRDDQTIPGGGRAQESDLKRIHLDREDQPSGHQVEERPEQQ